MTDRLSDLIDEMVRGQAFGPDAPGAVTALRDRALAQEARVERMVRTIADTDEAMAALRAQVGALSARLLAFEAREGGLAEREGRIRDLELREAAATARAGALSDVFGTIFGNAAVRESAAHRVQFGPTQFRGYTAAVPAGTTK